MSGVDLATKADDVRRLAYACPAFRRAVAEGLDRDDLLAAVYASIEERNKGANPWDPARGKGLGGWVTMVVRSVVVNQVEKHRGQVRRDAEVRAVLDEWPSVESDEAPASTGQHWPAPATGRPMEVVAVQVPPEERVVRRRTVLDRKPSKKARPKTEIRLPPDQHRELARLARESRRTVAWWVREFIAEGLARQGQEEER